MTLSRTDVRQMLESHGVRPSRALGQNFVVDQNTVRRIARLAGVGAGDRVIEVGAGVGSLTLALLETGASVTCVEVDKYLLPVLRETVESDGAVVIEGDAMDLDWGRVLGDESWTLVSNLPYNIATPLIATLLDEVPQVSRMLVMVQHEAGERLAAPPGGGAYGAVSVKVRYWAVAKLVGKVPRTVFYPEPNVDSVLVEIVRRETPAVAAEVVGPDRLFEVVRAGFAQRRKTLRRALDGVVDPNCFTEAGVDPMARAETLDVDAWGKLAACRPHPPTPTQS